MKLNNALILAFLLALSGAANATDPSTDDFSFLLGDWEIQALSGSNGQLDRKSSGNASCAYILEKAYVQCDIAMIGSSGKPYAMISLHNYNGIYGHHESLYLSSSKNWPIKVLGATTIEPKENEIHWTNHFEFEIDNGETEWVRAEMVASGNTIEASDFIKRTGESGNDWRLEFQSTWTRPSE